MTRVWQMVMPAEVFAGAIQIVHQVLGDGYGELTRRIPELAGQKRSSLVPGSRSEVGR